MVKKIFLVIFFMVAVVFYNVPRAHATPLALSYEISDLGGGLYDYEFELVMDNNDGSWSAGQTWNWLIFGDRLSGLSPLTNFVGDPNDLPIGPWSYYTSSSGGHNGPTLLDNTFKGWMPTFVGQSLSWSGTSSAYLGQGALLFSTLSDRNSAVSAYLEVAQLGPDNSTVPEPATMALFGLGGLAMAVIRRRKV
jgi:hypothetical protein